MNEPRLDDIVTSPRAEQTAEQLVAYWTDERKANAIPLPFPVLPPAAREAAPPRGGPVQADSVGPVGAHVSLGECFKTSPVNDMTVFPFSAVGKLFVKFGNVDYSGSAWVIGEKAICTAGHCLYDHEQGWATHVWFAGRFNNGSAIGEWAIPSLAVPREWYQDKDFAFDIGFGIATKPIRPTTGKLGWMANYPPNQGPYTEIGYPATAIPTYPFDGQRMWQSVGDYVGGSSVIQACGNLTGGSGGGPWAVFRNGKWRANGVNSHRRTDPNHIYSPYFGQAFLNLIDWMRQTGGD